MPLFVLRAMVLSRLDYPNRTTQRSIRRAYLVNSSGVMRAAAWLILVLLVPMWLTKFVRGYNGLTFLYEFVWSSVPWHNTVNMVLQSAPLISPDISLHRVQSIRSDLRSATWNSLPVDLRDPGLSLLSIRKELETYLFNAITNLWFQTLIFSRHFLKAFDNKNNTVYYLLYTTLYHCLLMRKYLLQGAN